MAGERGNSSVLLIGGRKEGNGLYVAKMLLLTWAGIRAGSKSREYAFLQYMEVTFQ